jgi:N-acetylmannosamine-6-phosphate 2-epimerase / N-acetylmannosamine kinase
MLLESLKQSLIVSCQPAPGGAMDSEHIVTAFALAALAGAASALRIESVAYVAAVRKMTNAPLSALSSAIFRTCQCA